MILAGPAGTAPALGDGILIGGEAGQRAAGSARSTGSNGTGWASGTGLVVDGSIGIATVLPWGRNVDGLIICVDIGRRSKWNLNRLSFSRDGFKISWG